MEVRSRRLDEIRLIKEDMPNPWTRYTGRSDSFLASDSDAMWQICRITKEGTVWTTTYANKGSYSAKWSDRTTYFPATTISYCAYGQSMGANFFSDPIVMAGNGLSVQAIWTGNDASDGQIILQNSNNGTDWCDYPNSSYTIPLTPGCKPIDVTVTSCPFFRVKYTKGANTTGTLDLAYNVVNINKPWAVK